MRKKRVEEKFADGTASSSGGLKRRDLLMSGTSLLALSTLPQAVLPDRRASAATVHRGNGRTSLSSWATTSACGISAPIAAA